MAEVKTRAESTIVERTLPSQIKLYYDLIAPSAPPAPLLIALHGYGASKWHATREAKAIAPENFGIVSLQGPHQHLKDPKAPGGPLRFGFGWLTNFHPEESHAIHHRALLQIIDSLIAEGISDPQRIFLLGFSQSCALNYRFAFTQPSILRGVIGICGGLPGDWETNETYQQTNAAVFHLAGNQDEFYTPAQIKDYAQQLARRANDVEFKGYEAGHEIIQPMRDDLREWLRDRSQ
jgi:phospholipase/carboxylesterase